VIAAAKAADMGIDPTRVRAGPIFLVGVVIVGFVRYEEYQLGELSARDAKLYFMLGGTTAPFIIGATATFFVAWRLQMLDNEHHYSVRIVNYFNRNQELFGSDFGPGFPATNKNSG